MRRARIFAMYAVFVLLVACVQPQPKAVEPTPAPPQPTAAEPVVPATPAAPALPPREPQPPPPPRVSDADRLLYYYAHIALLTPELAAQELERTQRFYGQHRSDFTLLQLVLLKSLPSASSKDRTQAVEWLAQYLKDNKEAGSELHALALLLHNLLSEQQRLDAESQAQAQKLKEEARRNEELKQKLDALIETERKMLERSKPTRNP
ncbi:MAG TPA: hypothetical protein VFA81_00720 [Burkholderiales bacterium]|nr:hypothetical protein [Burkholderiales bacterium]